MDKIWKENLGNMGKLWGSLMKPFFACRQYRQTLDYLRKQNRLERSQGPQKLN